MSKPPDQSQTIPQPLKHAKIAPTCCGVDRAGALTPPSGPPGDGPGKGRKRHRLRVRRLIEALRERRANKRVVQRKQRKAGPSRMKKRKAALAMSAGVMTLNTAAVDTRLSDNGAITMTAKVRKPAVFLKVSDRMKEAMIEEEGVREVVYRDVAGYPTVGVGHLVKDGDGLNVGDRVSQEQILDFLDSDLETAEFAVGRLVGNLPLYQHEFDALVDLVYNVGEGNVSEHRSPQLNAAIMARDYDAIAAELGYHHAGGAIANGLIHRSDRRANIFADADYADTRNEPKDFGSA